MISIFIIFSICLKICTCLIPTVYFNLDETTITKFPWMIAITNESFFISYGTLIHKKAVLTRAVLKPDPKNIESLRVYADCFFLGVEAFENNYNCSKVRQVSEYNVIEEHQNEYKKNLAILILTNSFKLSERVNIIELSKYESDIYSGNCGILSLKTVKNTNSDARFARFFSIFFVIMENRIRIKPYIPLRNFEGNEEYKFEIKSLEVENYIGSPLVCFSILPHNLSYVLVGVVNTVLRNAPNSYQLYGDVIRTDGENVHVQEIFKEIIKVSYLPKKNVRVKFGIL